MDNAGALPTALPPLAYLSPTNSTGPTILISTTRRSRGDRGCSEACTHPKRAALWCQFKRRSRLRAEFSKLTGSGSFRYWIRLALPDLHRLELVFRYLPDQDIIAALQQMRGHGRNDFPVATMWRALLAGVVFQHESIESLLRELRRNPALLTLCEFDPVPLQSPPKKVLERVDGVLRVDFISQPPRSTIYKTARSVACILSRVLHSDWNAVFSKADNGRALNSLPTHPLTYCPFDGTVH